MFCPVERHMGSPASTPRKMEDPRDLMADFPGALRPPVAIQLFEPAQAQG
jgi:hypothetical protein